MLEKDFEKLYFKFRDNYCRNLFASINEQKKSLSPMESYCVEAIFLLKRPTIHGFAEYVNISQPNATYYGANASFNTKLTNGIRDNFSKEEVELLEKMLLKIVDEIMVD